MIWNGHETQVGSCHLHALWRCMHATNQMFANSFSSATNIHRNIYMVISMTACLRLRWMVWMKLSLGQKSSFSRLRQCRPMRRSFVQELGNNFSVSSWAFYPDLDPSLPKRIATCLLQQNCISLFPNYCEPHLKPVEPMDQRTNTTHNPDLDWNSGEQHTRACPLPHGTIPKLVSTNGKSVLSINCSGTECYDVSTMGKGKGLCGRTCRTLALYLEQRRRTLEARLHISIFNSVLWDWWGWDGMIVFSCLFTVHHTTLVWWTFHKVFAIYCYVECLLARMSWCMNAPLDLMWRSCESIWASGMTSSLSLNRWNVWVLTI